MSNSSASSSNACSPITSYSDPFAGNRGGVLFNTDSSSDSGFGEMCKCGGDLKVEKVRYGPRVKILYRCSRREESGEHTEKTWDKAVGDELLSHWGMLLEHEDKLKELSCRFRDLANTVDPENLNRDMWTLQEQMSSVLDELASNSVGKRNIIEKSFRWLGIMKTRVTDGRVGRLWTWLWMCFAASIAANIYLMLT